jgi:hypothetical protein
VDVEVSLLRRRPRMFALVLRKKEIQRWRLEGGEQDRASPPEPTALLQLMHRTDGGPRAPPPPLRLPILTSSKPGTPQHRLHHYNWFAREAPRPHVQAAAVPFLLASVRCCWCCLLPHLRCCCLSCG